MPDNKAPGIDKIPIRVIKDCLPVISPWITSIINNSLANNIFPNTWKIAEVTPIPKEGDHELANNNRPISLLPVLSKVCERVAHHQLTSYLTTNHRLSVHQSGNKTWHSTETSLIHSTDSILKAIDQKKVTAVILLDMSKAFDSINHNILLAKLEDVVSRLDAWVGLKVISARDTKQYVSTLLYLRNCQWLVVFLREVFWARYFSVFM